HCCNQEKQQVGPREITRHRKPNENKEVTESRSKGEQEAHPERQIETSNVHRLNIHHHFESAIDHPLYFKWHWPTFHHLLHARILHDFRIHFIAMCTRLIDDKREEGHFAWFQFSCCCERNAPRVLEIIADRFDVLESAELFPDLPGLFSDVAVKLKVLLRHRYDESINVSHQFLLGLCSLCTV